MAIEGRTPISLQRLQKAMMVYGCLAQWWITESGLRVRNAVFSAAKIKFNDHGLLEPIGSIPQAGAEANYYRQLANHSSHECVDITVDWGISGQYVTRLLDRAALFRGYPLAVRTDNGPEFTSRAFMA